MTDIKPTKATRDGFGKGLVQAASADDSIVALCADLTDSVRMKEFELTYPDRFIQVGVAEQNLATVASGMAAMGKLPFISSYAAFSPGRNWEQIRTTICLNDQAVIIVGAHAGLSVGPDGATHQMLEDIALMRVLPNMIVVVPGDASEAEKATLALAKLKKPAYIRLAREASPDFTNTKSEFNIEKALVLKPGSDITIAGTGLMSYHALKAAEILEQDGISAEVIHFPVIKPFDSVTLISSARKTRSVVTIEEAQINAGFGGLVCEVLSEFSPTAVLRLGVKDRFGQSGKPAELYKEYQLDVDSIVKQVKVRFLETKKNQ